MLWDARFGNATAAGVEVIRRASGLTMTIHGLFSKLGSLFRELVLRVPYYFGDPEIRDYPHNGKTN